MTFSGSRVPILGALIDYLDTSLRYLVRKTFTKAENIHSKSARATLSSKFMAIVCLIAGITCNVKFEITKFDKQPLPRDLHFMLFSNDDKLYIDDIDMSRILWCLEASDVIVVLISCIFVWSSSNIVSIVFSY
ncbi:hypothetical protein ACJJTC_013038 [Scirpophaga incertulas]